MRAALLALALLLAVPAVAQAGCPAPRKLSFERKAGAASGLLSWRAAHGAPHGLRYRVYRERKVIGQTTRLRMRVRVSVGHSYWFVVRPVTRSGRLMRCWGSLQQRVRYMLPTVPDRLGVTGADAATAHLSWTAAR